MCICSITSGVSAKENIDDLMQKGRNFIANALALRYLSIGV